MRPVVASVVVVVLVCASPVVEAQETPKPVWLVVTRPMFVDAIAPLVKHRRAEGFEAVVSVASPKKALKALGRTPAFVVLVGDVRRGRKAQPWHVPTTWRPLYRWRITQRKQFAADSLFGDLDGDLVADVPVGRIPVRRPGDLKTVVAKIIAYEKHVPAPVDLRLLAWTGSPDYNPFIDSIAAGFAVEIVRRHAPDWAGACMICGDARHPLCGWPAEQPATFSRWLKEGGALAVFMGHGAETHFFSMKSGDRSIGYTAAHARKALVPGDRTPVMVFFTCNAGHFTGEATCLAESLLLMPGGPPAVIAATTESHPLTNYFSGCAIVGELGGGVRRVGRLWLNSERKARRARSFLMERLLKDVEGKLEPKINVANLRRDQVLMFDVFGDPAMRLPLPGRWNCRAVRKDDGWHWQAEKPEGATRLYVGLREPPSTPEKRTGPLDPKTARNRFEAANAACAFRPLAQLGAADPWGGVVTRPGMLRLIAITPKRTYAATLTLRAPSH